MGTGQDIVNNVINKGKDILKDMSKKAVKMLLKNPYFYAVVGVIFVIIIIAGSMVDVNAQGTNNTSGMYAALYGTISVNECNLTKDEFVKCVQDYRDDDGYQTRFAKYAETIYDICTSKNINPIICVAQAGNESNFGASVPTNSKWNYWGLAVYNDSNTGKEFNNISNAIEYYCDIILGYQESGSIAYQKAQVYAPYSNKITGNMDTIYDIFCCYAFLGAYHNGKICEGVNVKTYLVDYMNFNCSHGLDEATTTEEQAAYAVDYVDNHIIQVAKNIFGEGIISSGNSWGDINLYNSDGSVNEAKIQELEYAFENEFNLVRANLSGHNIGGTYNKESCTKVIGTFLGYSGKTGNTSYNDASVSYIANNGLGIYQCTWWANGRASEYLSQYGTKYKSYPSAAGNGGQIYNNNKWFNSGKTPKPNSLVSYTSSSSTYGHVAYVEAVDTKNNCYYISHAGSGASWFGIQKVTIGQGPWGWNVVGFVYLDEPLS